MDNIVYVSGNLLEGNCDAVVCPVNMVGVMGAGLARQMAIRYRGLDRMYQGAIESGELDLGKPCLVSSPLWPHRVVLFATKDHWKHLSDFSWISEGLRELCCLLEECAVETLGMPKLGCGLGGLPWDLVHHEILETLEDSHSIVHIYA